MKPSRIIICCACLGALSISVYFIADILGMFSALATIGCVVAIAAMIILD